MNISSTSSLRLDEDNFYSQRREIKNKNTSTIPSNDIPIETSDKDIRLFPNQFSINETPPTSEE